MLQAPSRIFLLICGLAFALSGCAQLPQAVAELPWSDAWGDRGAGVLARDYEMCERLVEQRRSALSGCMAARGWLVSSKGLQTDLP